MEPDEAKEHDCHNTTQEHNDRKHLILFLQVLQNDAPVCLESLALAVNKRLIPQITLIDQVQGAEVADDCSIYTYAEVHKEEEHEPLVVVQAHTVVDPYTVVVEFLAAHVTEVAMLTASRFWRFTSVAPALVVEHDIVIIVSLYGAFDHSLVSTFPDKAWVRRTGKIVAVVACQHEGPGNVLMILANVWIGDVLKAVHDIQIVAANG